MDVPGSVKRGVLGCYTCELIALAIWIGGLLVIIGSVIPAVFNSFGMEQGGRFLTRVFDGYNRLVIAAIVILLVTGGVRLWINSRYPRAGACVSPSEVILLGVMIASAATIIGVLGPITVKLQEEAFAIKEEIAKKAAYAAFFKTHMTVRGLYIANLMLGIVLMTVKLKSWMKMDCKL